MNIIKRWRQRIKEWWLDRPHPSGAVIKGNYEIIHVLGMGSYGISYIVFDHKAKEKRVLKQMRPSRLNSPKGKTLYEYEINMLAALRHPRMPRLFDSFEENGQLYYVMNYIQGKTLEDLLFEENRKFGEREAWEIILELLALIKHLHERRIIHRDVRIPNVIWNDDGIYLLDFGLARYLDDSPSYLETTNDHYWPEKRLKREVHPRSDIYALGHFMLFMLYSTYEAKAREAERIWEEELTLTPATVRILRRMLQLDTPYATTAELERDIQDFLEQQEKRF
ncbi:serine/threonine-protein kinase [Aneurinibacillus thermoaerophilus]|uniref:serine/threonine protein kinase n=1 Tax=Aneurinibacillus thermoaerophilus TaxID=143495 RepID=UPI002E24009E|nr:serine/threonine-protein kinase [Aneurinibacillus thermoaerophilus]